MAKDADKAIAHFRDERLTEPLEKYLDEFDAYRDTLENLIEGTVDLKELPEQAVGLLADPALLTAIRYLASPAISEDDLRVLAEASLAPGKLRRDPVMARRVIDTVLLGLDRNRFPWVTENREPSESERDTAIVSTAALIATQKVQTYRRNTSKDEQEAAVAAALVASGFSQAIGHDVANVSHLPQIGEFFREYSFGSRKADLIVRLWDGRVMPIECKVSNSYLNSVKRLNNDAAAKATAWIVEWGTATCIPAAVLAGVYKTHNLEAAQAAGLTLFWAHDLAAMIEFIEITRP